MGRVSDLSALTPDEQAELSDLTRRLFAPGAVNDEVAQQRYAELEMLRRERADHEIASRPSPLPDISPPEPTDVTRTEVPPSGATEAQYDEIPGLGELMASSAAGDAPSTGSVAQPAGGAAIVESTSDAPRGSGRRTSRHGQRTRVVSVAVGLGIAAAGALIVSALTSPATPQPVAAGQLKPITLDELPEMGSNNEAAIAGRLRVAGGDLSQYTGFADVNIVVVESAFDDGCVYLHAVENPSPDGGRMYCRSTAGPYVVDLMEELLHDVPLPRRLEEATFYRIVINNGEVAVWADPPATWGEY